LKKNVLGAGHAFPGLGNKFIKQQKTSASDINCCLQSQLQKSLEDMSIDGEIGLKWTMIEGSGKGGFQSNTNRHSRDLVMVQSGYVETNTILVKTAMLQADTAALKTGAHVHDQLRDVETAKKFVEENGYHFIESVTMGARAHREICIKFDSAHDRKKI